MLSLTIRVVWDQVALGREEGTLSGRLLIYDAMRMRFHEVRMKPRASAPKITSLIDYDGFCGVPSSAEGAAPPPPPTEPFSRIGVLEAARRMREDGWAPYVLDVRSAAEAEIVSFPFVDQQQPHRQGKKGGGGGRWGGGCIPTAITRGCPPPPVAGVAHRRFAAGGARHPRPLQGRRALGGGVPLARRWRA